MRGCTLALRFVQSETKLKGMFMKATSESTATVVEAKEPVISMTRVIATTQFGTGFSGWGPRVSGFSTVLKRLN